MLLATSIRLTWRDYKLEQTLHFHSSSLLFMEKKCERCSKSGVKMNGPHEIYSNLSMFYICKKQISANNVKQRSLQWFAWKGKSGHHKTCKTYDRPQPQTANIALFVSCWIMHNCTRLNSECNDAWTSWECNFPSPKVHFPPQGRQPGTCCGKNASWYIRLRMTKFVLIN